MLNIAIIMLYDTSAIWMNNGYYSIDSSLLFFCCRLYSQIFTRLIAETLTLCPIKVFQLIVNNLPIITPSFFKYFCNLWFVVDRIITLTFHLGIINFSNDMLKRQSILVFHFSFIVLFYYCYMFMFDCLISYSNKRAMKTLLNLVYLW